MRFALTSIAVRLLGLALAATTPTLALADDMAGMHETHQHAAQKATAPAAMSEGTIKKVDKAAGKLTIAHGPLDNLNMPAMTMAFRVKDAAWLEQIKEGERIRFVAEDIKGTLTVVRYEKTQ